MNALVKRIAIGLSLFLFAGCSTKIANAPFQLKSISDEALTIPGNVQYIRIVKVTPNTLALSEINKHTNQMSYKLSPEVIAAAAGAIDKAVTPIVKTSQQSYTDLRSAAQIEVIEFYFHGNATNGITAELFNKLP
jgi:CRISPR/Cas system-associated protein Csx1